MTVSLYLVRHGQTEWSLSGQYTGRSDIPLTAQGEDEARALAPWLANFSFDFVLTSPRQRALRTCTLAGLSATAEVDDLAEWDYGDYEGKRSADIHSERPHWTIFQEGCPGGETPMDITLRANRLIARLRTMHGRIALFSHGHFGAALAARWIGLPVIESQHLSLSTASVSVLDYASAHPYVPVIALWNTTPGRRPE